MKTFFHSCGLTLASLVLVASAEAHAQEIWSGSGISFSKAAFGDTSLPANQDRLTAMTSITRADSRGLFNIQLESAFGAGSPANTEWAFDLTGNGNSGLTITATNFAALTFEPWVAAVNNAPPSSVGIPGVLHLIAENIYVDLRFTSWAAGGGGGGAFSYVRGGPSASLTTRNVSPNPSSLTANSPVIGSPFVAFVDLASTGHNFAVLVLYTTPVTVPLRTGQVMLVGGSLVCNMGMQPGPTAVYAASIPSDTSLAGLALSLQAVHWTGQPRFALSNALDVVVGF